MLFPHFSSVLGSVKSTGQLQGQVYRDMSLLSLISEEQKRSGGTQHVSLNSLAIVGHPQGQQGGLGLKLAYFLFTSVLSGP